MKKGQATIEYIICIVLAVVLCWGIGILWNKHTIINSSNVGTEDAESGNIVNIRPMEN